MAYKVFICHAHDHQDIYFDLVRKLNAVGGFDWRNLSVQYDMRFGSAEEDFDNLELRAEIGKRINECDILLALTKPIASRRKWLQWEIARARELGKPVVGIARKKNDRVSAFVRKHADDIVDTWRIDHIINAIIGYTENTGSSKNISGNRLQSCRPCLSTRPTRSWRLSRRPTPPMRLPRPFMQAQRCLVTSCFEISAHSFPAACLYSRSDDLDGGGLCRSEFLEGRQP